MRQLKVVDALHLYQEKNYAPSNVACFLILESTDQKEPLTFQKLKELVQSRLYTSPVFTQRLVEVPLKLGLPYWADDPEFSLNLHLHHHVLPEPGDQASLQELYKHIFLQPLDRSRPLWEIHLIEGLEGGDSAMVTKFHHVAVDGISGAQLLELILDSTPDVQITEVKNDWKPTPIPEDIELLKRTFFNVLKAPKQLENVFYSLTHDTKKIIDRLGKNLLDTKNLELIQGITVKNQIPHTRFNAPVSSDRSWGQIQFPLAEMKAIGKGGNQKFTINDVFLTVCSTTLRRYLLEKNELPEVPLVTSVPISVRKKNEQYMMGNRVTILLVPLATNEADPTKRLGIIHENTRVAKNNYREFHPEIDLKLIQLIPNAIAQDLIPYLQKGHERGEAPLYNLAITNIPGPRKGLYALGSSVRSVHFAASVLDGFGLVIAGFSYNGNFSVTITTCQKMIPEIDQFMGYFEEAYQELAQLYLKEG